MREPGTITRQSLPQSLPPAWPQAALTLARRLDDATAALLVAASNPRGAVALAAEPNSAEPNSAAALQSALHRALMGQAEAARHERDASAEELDRMNCPRLRLARAYRRAFEALGVASLLLADVEAATDSARPLAELVELASQVAHALVIAAELLHDGSEPRNAAQLRRYISDLEHEADVRYLDAISALYDLDDPNDREGREVAATEARAGMQTAPGAHAQEFRLLTALEALINRCEEISDALLETLLLGQVRC